MVRKRGCHTIGVDELDESYSFSKKMAHSSKIWIVCPNFCFVYDCNSTHQLNSDFQHSTGKIKTKFQLEKDLFVPRAE